MKRKKSPHYDPHEQCRMSESEIDESLDETFPASDPPTWTLGLEKDRKKKEEKEEPLR